MVELEFCFTDQTIPLDTSDPQTLNLTADN